VYQAILWEPEQNEICYMQIPCVDLEIKKGGGDEKVYDCQSTITPTMLISNILYII